MASKQVVDGGDAVTRITAAVAAGKSGMMLMARTDARAVIDMDESLRRGEAFVEAGADILFIEAPQSFEELRRVAETFKGARLVANMVEDGKTPYLSIDELSQMGFALAIYPVSTLLVVARRLQEAYAAMRTSGRLPETESRLRFNDYNSMIGLDELVPSAVNK